MVERATSFGKVVEAYEKGRPGYPAEAIADTIRWSGILLGDPVLEIGCGTGKATKALAAQGLTNVEALDPSETLIAQARKRLGDQVQFIHGRFEDLKRPAGSYRLILAAQAFHWLDPAVRTIKARRLLSPDGSLAIINNFQEFLKSPLEIKVLTTYCLLCPNFPHNYGDQGKLRAELSKNGFLITNDMEYHRVVEYQPEEYRALQASLSWVSTLEEERKRKFFDELDRIIGGQKTIRVPWKTTLLLAKPQAQTP